MVVAQVHSIASQMEAWVCLNTVWAEISALVFRIHNLAAQETTAAEKNIIYVYDWIYEHRVNNLHQITHISP